MIKKQAGIEYSKYFEKQLVRTPLKIKIAFRRRREIFTHNPISPILHNHQLTGKLKDYKSINITGDWRALFSEVYDNREKIIVFEMIGTHSQLYR